MENEIQECQDKLNEYISKEDEDGYYDASLSMILIPINLKKFFYKIYIFILQSNLK